MRRRSIVLLVEDNWDLLYANRRIFEAAGYTVLTAETLDAARDALSRVCPDAIVLDILMPDGSGLDFCRALRSPDSAFAGKNPALRNVPILFLTALSEKRQVVDGLRAGGDDYMSKPYDKDELIARVEGLLRRVRIGERETSHSLRRGPLLLDVLSQRAFLNGAELKLTSKQLLLLYVLLQNEGRLLSAESLYRQVWKTPLAGDGNALWTQISHLKNKLAECDAVTLVSVRGKGYMLEIEER